MENIFESTHFNTIGTHLRKEFGCQITKLSIDAGFTCPNRDGTCGTGGCIYCSDDGAGHFAGNIPDQINLLSHKWPTGKYIAYFQSYTNTYAPVEHLREIYENALIQKDIVGISIATRPDCLSQDVINLLTELNQRTYLWVELGLQTKNDSTALLINRCYPTGVFDEAMEKLSRACIRTVVHLIFGLPGESRKDMLSSVDYVADKKPFGIKFHQLYIMNGTLIAKQYPNKVKTLEMDEYIHLVVDALERLPQDITVHRVTGDAPQNKLIAPMWSLNKRAVLNGIQKEFKQRGTFQGYSYSPKRPSL